jgi:2-haloacid dehalogenase
VSERWATFDCYGTLIDWDGGIAAGMHALWPEAERPRLLERYHAVEPLVQAGGALPYREVLRRSLRAVAAIEDLPLAPAEETALADGLPAWPAFPDVPPGLRELRDRGVRLAILSNTDPDLLAASLEQIGVPVELRVTAAEAGSYKPALGHWRRFYAESGADPARHVHVGASPFHDLEPAAGLGLPAIWINRTGERSPAPRASELPDLSALADAIDRLVPPS